MDRVLDDFAAPPPGIRIKRRWNLSAKSFIGLSAVCFLFAAIVMIVTISTLKVVPHRFWQTETDDDSPVVAVYGAVSSGNSVCNQVGVAIMKEGGNAIDASLATALCIGVRNPFASGIGGGGVMLIHLANGTDLSIDCRETAPASSFGDMFLQFPGASFRGGLSIGTPGELKCIDYAWKKFGSYAMGTGLISMERIFRDAIKFARDGFQINSLLASRLAAYETLILNDPGLRSVWTNANGTLLKQGQTVYMTKLAQTLQQLAFTSIQDFYTGSLANTVAKEISSIRTPAYFGGKNPPQFNVTDLHNYSLKFKGVYNTTYHGQKVVGAPLPFSGSTMLMQTLNILEKFDLPQEGFDEQTYHYILEAAKFGFGNRVVLGDPDFANLTDVIGQMLSKERAQDHLFDRINSRTHDPAYYIDIGDDESVRGKRRYVFPPSDEGTTHISVVDARRNAVAFTTSINSGWGSGFMGTETGIIYNNQMDDFSLNKTDSSFAVTPANFPAPNKRPLSSMTPTFIYDPSGKLIFVTGGAGGPKIFSGTLQTILNIFDFNFNVHTSSKLPRIHNQLNPNIVYYEDFMGEEFVEKLRARGHIMEPVKTPYNYINSVQVNWNADGTSTLAADSDWRKEAVSFGYKKRNSDE